MKSGEKSRAMFQRALEAIPCGVNSNFRYWGDEETLVLKTAKGAYIWDQDDKKYVDYRLGFGPVILGHAYESVTDKIKEGLEIGNAFSMTHEYEIEAAEKIKKLADVDLVRFANSGTEATMHAIRIARAFTGRDKVLKFEGAYHGFHDYTLWNCQPPPQAPWTKTMVRPRTDVCSTDGAGAQAAAQMVINPTIVLIRLLTAPPVTFGRPRRPPRPRCQKAPSADR